MKRNRIGKLPAQFAFSLNQYADVRFTRCPICERQMNPRKFALLIHVEGAEPAIPGKTCRYCPKCELIIAHQDELEGVLARAYSAFAPGVIGNPYLVLGTVQLKGWRDGLEGSVPFSLFENHTTQFKKRMTLSADRGGWKPTKGLRR